MNTLFQNEEEPTELGNESLDNGHENSIDQVQQDENLAYEKIKNELQEKTKLAEEHYAMAQRLAAEFDNFKKRTAREKESLFEEAMAETIEEFLPVLDNLERAMQTANSQDDPQALKSGLDLILRQFKDVLKKLNVEEIKCVGETFNHEVHNAVMHIDDDSYSENTVVEEFQKGYVMKSRVIRHSMVKVAN